MNKILLGEEAESFLRVLYIQHYKHKTDTIGGIFISEEGIYTAYDYSDKNETFVEDFDDVVEAAKYTNGIQAKTINGEII